MAQRQTLGQAASLGPQGPGKTGPAAAIQLIQDMAQHNAQMQQRATQKLIQIQQQAAMQQQQASQDMQSGVADIANQVSGGIQRMHQERNQRAEMAEKTRQTEDMMVFQQKLAQDAAKEGQRIGLAMRQAEQAAVGEIERWKAKRDQMVANHDASVAAFSQMVQEGKFSDIPGGYQKMVDIQKALRMSRAYAEDHTDPAYLQEVVRLQQEAERDIAEGRAPIDLAAMFSSPQTSVYEGIEPPKSRVDSLEGEEAFRIALRDGYPENGIFNLSPDDPKLEHVKVITPDVMAQVLIDNSMMSSFITEESRKKAVESRIRSLAEANERYQGFINTYDGMNKMSEAQVPEALRRGLESFIVDHDPARFNRPGEAIFDRSLKAMFPEHGDEFVKLYRGIRDGTVEIDTPAEFALAAQIESASFMMSKRASTSLQQIGQEVSNQGSSPTLVALAQEYAALLGPNRVRELWGNNAVDRKGHLTGVGLVAGQREAQKMLESLTAYATEVNQSAWEVGALAEFRREFGTNSRMVDLYNHMIVTQNAEDKEHARNLLYGEIQSQVDSMSPEDLDSFDVQPSENIRRSRNILDSTLEFLQQVKPSELPRAAAILSGGQVDLTDGNIPKFNAATASIAERSEYMQLVLDRMRDARNLQEEIQEKHAKGEKITPKDVLELRKAKTAEREAKAAAFREQYGAVGAAAHRTASAVAEIGPAMDRTFNRATDKLYQVGAAAGGRTYTNFIDKLAMPIAKLQTALGGGQQ